MDGVAPKIWNPVNVSSGVIWRSRSVVPLFRESASAEAISVKHSRAPCFAHTARNAASVYPAIGASQTLPGHGERRDGDAVEERGLRRVQRR